MVRFSVVIVTVLSVVGTAEFGDCENQSSPSLRSDVAAVQDRIIHVTALLPVPPDEAFTYFTDNNRLESWLTGGAEVEAKVGGKYELFWQPEDRENNSTIGCRVTALAPGQLIAFQWRSPVIFKSFANGADPLTHVVVSFSAEGSGTRVHLLHSGWRSDENWEEARLWQETAWTMAFRELQRVASE